MEIDIHHIQKNEKQWANYILGVIDEFHKKGFDIQGFDCVFGGNIPHGAGLSSSAALETVFTFALNHLHHFEIPNIEMTKMAQMAEVNFVGVNCGIMDQFISFNGQKDKALLLDCRTLEYEYKNIYLEGYSIILVDTLVKHALASGEYNTRRQECEQGVKILQGLYPHINSLRDVTIAQLKEAKPHFSDIIYKRCQYVVEENERVQQAGHYLEQQQAEDFGQMLFKSHEGLSKLYEVSCTELDVLVTLAKATGNVIGARMMGGGFGGCTINVVKTEAKEAFKTQLQTAFQQQFGHAPKFYEVSIENGAEVVEK